MVESGQAGTGTAKAWGGRFSDVPDARLEAFNASVGFDIRLVREDIRGSIAHVRMLGTREIIPADDAEAIEQGLWRILDEVEEGAFALTVAAGDGIDGQHHDRHASGLGPFEHGAV